MGGGDTKWGKENAGEVAAATSPDLAIIAFGMNDSTASVCTATYIWNTLRIMATIRAQHPDCEFILVSSMLLNPQTAMDTGMHAKYSKALNRLAQEGVAVADMTQMHAQLLQRKPYADMSGNNLHHPNDFLSRAYAQVLLDTTG